MTSVPRMHHVLVAVVSLLSLVGWAADAAAKQDTAPLSLRVDAPTTAVEAGDAFQLDVVVSMRAQGTVEELSLPELPRGLTVLQERRAQSTQLSTVNGQRQMLAEQRYMYLLRADEPGVYVIPSATARAGGTSARSAPVTIRVVGGSPPDPDDSAGAGGAAAGGAAENTAPTPGARFGRSPPAAFLEVTLDTSEAWVGQQITATTELFTQQPLAQWPRLAALKPAGFFCASLLDDERPAPTQRIIAGRHYYIYLVNKDALFPLSAGEKTIPMQQVELAPAGSLFSRPRDVVARSAPVTLKVKDLPDEGRPEGFVAGNVGHWQLEASVHPSTTVLGEPVTLTIVASGVGSLEQLQLPTWDGGSAARVFPATVRREPRLVGDRDTELGGRVVMDVLVQPHQEGELRIPALTLATFDPSSATWQESSTKPLTLTVVSARRHAPGPSQPMSPQVIAQGTRPLKRNVVDAPAPSEAPVWVGAATCAAGAFVWGAARMRALRQGSAAGRRTTHMRSRLRSLGDAVGRGDLAALERLVLDAHAERYGAELKSCATAELPALLAGRGMPRTEVDLLVRFIQDIEAARYARSSASSSERDALSRTAHALVMRALETQGADALASQERP